MRNELVNEMYASSVVYCMLYLVTIKHGCVCKHLHCMSVQRWPKYHIQELYGYYIYLCI